MPPPPGTSKAWGLPWQEKIVDIYDREIKPGHDAQYASFNNKISAVYARSIGMLPTRERGLATALGYMVRRLRSFEYVAAGLAVGQEADQLEWRVIMPGLWDVLRGDVGRAGFWGQA